MNKVLLLIVVILLGACGTQPHIPQENEEVVEIPNPRVPFFGEWPGFLISDDCTYPKLYIYDSQVTASKSSWGVRYYSALSFQECGENCFESREDFFYIEGDKYIVDYGNEVCFYTEESE